MRDLSKSSLSPAFKHLLGLMQSLNFGRLENLDVRDGEPIVTPETRAVRDTKFGNENGPRAEKFLGDFLLKKQVVDLVGEIRALGNGRIECLEVKHGLPFLMRTAEMIGMTEA